MVEIEFWINGRNVSLFDMKNALEAAIIDTVREKLTRKLGDLRCPDHHEAPRVTVVCTDFSDLKYSVRGCCPKLRDEALRALG